MGSNYTLFITNESYHDKVKKCAEIFGKSIGEMYGNYFYEELDALCSWERCGAISTWLLEKNSNTKEFHFQVLDQSNLECCVNKLSKLDVSISDNKIIHSKLSNFLKVAKELLDDDNIKESIILYDVC